MTEDSLKVYNSVSGRTLTFDKPAVILFSPLRKVAENWPVEKQWNMGCRACSPSRKLHLA